MARHWQARLGGARRGSPALRGTALAAAGVVLSGALLAGCGSTPRVTAPPPPPPPPSATGSAPPDPGVSDTSVTIASHQPLTGPAAPGYKEIAPAAKAYFDFLNARGGIYGRSIRYTYTDDGFDPTRAVRAVRDLLAGDQTFAVFNGLGTAPHAAVADLINAAHVPDLFAGSGCTCWNSPASRPYTFGWQPDSLIEGKILGRYVADHFPGRKVGYLYENDAFGQEGVKGLDLQIPAGAVVDKEGYAPTSDSLVAQVSALKEKGAQVVVAFTLPVFTATYALTAAELGLGAKLVTSSAGSDPATLTAALARLSQGQVTGAVLTGMVTDSYLPSPDDLANPWVRLFRRIHDADPAVSKLDFDQNVVYGMSVAYTFAQALIAAGPHPTRAGLVAAVSSGRFARTPGPGLAPLRYAPGVHAGFAGAQLGSVSGGKLILSGPVQVTDDAAGPVSGLPAPTPSAPADGVPPAP